MAVFVYEMSPTRMSGSAAYEAKRYKLLFVRGRDLRVDPEDEMCGHIHGNPPYADLYKENEAPQAVSYLYNTIDLTESLTGRVSCNFMIL